MLRVLTALCICAAAQAATTSLTINATAAISSTGYALSGTATLSGGISGSGTFSSTVPLTALESGGTTASAQFTISLSAGSLGGTLVIPVALLESPGSGTGSATISSASGSYAGDTGTFSSLAETAAIGGSGISYTFTGSATINTGGTVTVPAPNITAVLDAGSYTANIAQGSIFVVKGTNMSASGLTQFSYPLPALSGGVSINFTPTNGGATTNAYLVYTYNESGVNQLAAVLPSSLAVGNYNVTVTYNGNTSTSFAVQVVANKPAMLSQDATGTGLTLAQNIVSATEYDINRLTTGSVAGITISPAKPGETLVIYATGLGPYPGADNQAEQAYNFLTNGASIQVLVGGTAVTPLYAGRVPGFSGLDQINITLPSSVTAGCTVPVEVIENGVMSVETTLSIAPNASSTACVLTGYTATQLAALDNGQTITSGAFGIEQITENVPTVGNETFSSVAGGFTQVTGYQLQALPFSYSSVTSGACTVVQVSGAASDLTVPGTPTNLDAGTVTISGPSGSSLSQTPLVETSNVYSLTIGAIDGYLAPGAVNGSIVAGTYTLAGGGGKDVKSFSTALTLGTPLTLSSAIPSVIPRSQALTLNWTGGNSTDSVEIIGSSGTSSTTGSTTTVTATEFICSTTAGAKTFTVPSSVLSQLPATGSTASGGYGALQVESGPSPVTFSPSLTAGGTVASTFAAFIGTFSSVTFQ